MSTKDNGGPAAPTDYQHQHAGLTVRDYAAIEFAKAMIASPSLLEVVTTGAINNGEAADRVMVKAFAWADVFIAESRK